MISIKFSTHIDAIPKLYLTPLIFMWRHRVSHDSVSKGQISKVNICKREWSIDFNFGVHLSWEEVYPKFALMWLWRHLMNIYDVMKFLEICLHLSIFGKRSDFFSFFSFVSIGTIVFNNPSKPKGSDVIMTSSNRAIM